MTPCKGIHRIVCTMAGGCPRKLKNIQFDCISCPEAVTQILDLDGKVLYEYQVEKNVSRKGAKPQNGKKQKEKKIPS